MSPGLSSEQGPIRHRVLRAYANSNRASVNRNPRYHLSWTCGQEAVCGQTVVSSRRPARAEQASLSPHPVHRLYHHGIWPRCLIALTATKCPGHLEPCSRCPVATQATTLQGLSTSRGTWAQITPHVSHHEGERHLSSAAPCLFRGRLVAPGLGGAGSLGGGLAALHLGGAGLPDGDGLRLLLLLLGCRAGRPGPAAGPLAGGGCRLDGVAAATLRRSGGGSVW